MKIRKIEETDYPTIIGLIKKLAEFQKMPEKVTNSLEQMKHEKELINGFVAENINNEIIGYVTCFYAYFTWVGKSLYVDDLYVKEDSRRQGIGGQLINAIIEKGKTENCARIRWQVSKWNHNAINIYKKIGAEIEETEANCTIELK